MIDAIVPEPVGGAHRAPQEAIFNVGEQIAKALAETLADPRRRPAPPAPGEVSRDGAQSGLIVQGRYENTVPTSQSLPPEKVFPKIVPSAARVSGEDGSKPSLHFPFAQNVCSTL